MSVNYFNQYTNKTTYDANYYVVGYDSDDSTSASNLKISLPNMIAIIQSQLLYATPIADIIDNCGGTAGTIPLITNSTGGSGSTTLAAVTDTSASDQSAPINNGITSLLEQMNIMSKTLSEKINAINTALEGAGIISKT